MSMGSFSSRGVRANMRVVEVRETVLQVEGHRLSPKAKSSGRKYHHDTRATYKNAYTESRESEYEDDESGET